MWNEFIKKGILNGCIVPFSQPQLTNTVGKLGDRIRVRRYQQFLQVVRRVTEGISALLSVDEHNGIRAAVLCSCTSLKLFQRKLILGNGAIEVCDSSKAHLHSQTFFQS